MRWNGLLGSLRWSNESESAIFDSNEFLFVIFFCFLKVGSKGERKHIRCAWQVGAGQKMWLVFGTVKL